MKVFSSPQSGLVDPDPDLPDDDRGEADREVEDGLEDVGAAHGVRVEQQRKPEPAQGGEQEREHHPDDGVHDGVGEQPVGHDPDEVLEPDEAVARIEAAPVGEAVVEGVEERPDDEDPEYRQGQDEQGDPPEDGVTVHRAAAARVLRAPGPAGPRPPG